MNNNIIKLIVLIVSFSNLSLYAMEPEERRIMERNIGVFNAEPEALRDYNEAIQRIEAEEIEALVPKAKKKEEVLFARADTYSYDQNLDLSMQVYQIIETKRPSDILFQYSNTFSYDHGGTCSAMALDFAARFDTICSKPGDFKKSKECVKKFEPYYKSNNSTFISRQTAYNSIGIKYSPSLTEEDIRFQKMQALANYHNLTLVPETGIISADFIENHSSDFQKLLKNLDNGLYVVRGIYPDFMGVYLKREIYGHTMSFIKYKDSVLFYNNGKGAFAFVNNPWNSLRSALLAYSFPEFSIYKAACPDEGCINLSEERSN